MNNIKNKEKAANWHTIFDNLSGKEFDSKAIAELLGLSDTAGYKYRTALVQEGLAVVLNPERAHNEAAIYRIVDDQQAIDTFLQKVCDGLATLVRIGRRVTAPAIPGVKIHVLADDYPVYTRAAKVDVRRDPLDVALFGPARVQAVKC